MLYFLSADDRSITASDDAIRTAAKQCSRRLLFDIGQGKKAPCTLAALYTGYVTAVLDNTGAIVQDWAGSFTLAEVTA
jgi:hypothetical protein